MRATYMYGAGDVRVIDIPDPKLREPTDALARIMRACVCGSDLHPYHSLRSRPMARRWGMSSSASSRKPGQPCPP